jgi:hypothetical protein
MGQSSVQVMLAGPPNITGRDQTGHVASARLARSLGLSEIAVYVSDDNTDSFAGVSSGRVSAGLLQYSWSRGGGWLGIDAGLMRIQDNLTGEVYFGPAIDAKYSYRGNRGYLDVRALTRPMPVAIGQIPAPQALASGLFYLNQRWAALGSVSLTDLPVRGSGSSIGSYSGSAGARYTRDGFRVDLTGNYDLTSGLVRQSRQTGKLDAGYWINNWSIDGSAEIGQGSFGIESGLVQEYQLSLNWFGGFSWLTSSLTITDGVVGDVSSLASISGGYAVTSFVNLYGGFSTYLSGFAKQSGVNARLGAEVEIRPELVAYAGVESYVLSSFEEKNTRLSVGLRSGFPLPLPVPQKPAVRGVVFADFDGDGVRDPGEPPLEGVRIQMGRQRTVTRSDGRFEFQTERAPVPLRVDPASLGEGLIAPGEIPIMNPGRVEIPIQGSGGLKIRAFYDANGNGVRDPGEMPAQAVDLLLTYGDDTVWELRTDNSGEIGFSAITPGTYIFSAKTETLPRTASTPGPLPVVVVSGDEITVDYPIPVRIVRYNRIADDDDD